MRNLLLAISSAFLFAIPVLAQDAAPAQKQNLARPIVTQMIKAMDNVQTLSGRVKRRERIEGRMVTGEMRFKTMMDPYKVYIYNVKPNEGVEVLYVTGWNNNKASVNPNGFPWVSVSLDPFGGRMLEDQHHTCHDVGFEYTNRVVKHVLEKHGDKFDEFVSYEGTKKQKK
ncbi:MAG: DUF1571 domain-containing protein, partial [Bacteroidota bacterium]